MAGDPCEVHGLEPCNCDASEVSFVPTGSIAATNVQDAIEEVAAEAIAPVTSVFGRTGAVTALQADYDAFFTTPAEAAAAAPVQSVFGRTGTVVAQQADYDGFFLTPAEGDAAYLAKPALTGGSVLFAASGQVQQDNANFFYDNANDSLLLGTNVALDAGVRLQVVGTASEIGVLIRGDATPGDFLKLQTSTGLQRAVFNSAGGLKIGNTTITDATNVALEISSAGGGVTPWADPVIRLVDGTGAAVGRIEFGNNTGTWEKHMHVSELSNVLGGELRWLHTTGLLKLATTAALPIQFATTNTTRWEMVAAGHLVAFADNTYDIGAAGATRPRTAYLGTSLFVGATKVVGVQGAAVADAAGGAIIDIEARAAINALLARLRAATGHGLIA